MNPAQCGNAKVEHSTPEMTPDNQRAQVSGRNIEEKETEECWHNEERLNWKLEVSEEQLDMSSSLVSTRTMVG